MDTQKFQKFIRSWYFHHGRHTLPWRLTRDPYHILVSELMLQQTQVERVIPKYLAFIEKFPSTKVLAAAPLSEVLIMWQGLGYNRRAKYALQCAKAVEETYAGHFPQTEQELLELPGIGPYTASAICAFAYDQPVVLIETNVRTIYLYHFFPLQESITDTELLAHIQETVDEENPREWYWALMDYGSYLKKILPNQNRRSKQYTKQSKFTGSLRQVRGEIIRLLTQENRQHTSELIEKLRSNPEHFKSALDQLLDEKLVVQDSGYISLAE